ncbi:helix-turn-helix domain-containing protein [Prosthecobacter sp.]|uniref:helix-turn-helix domain-containing protein n=1 Tax=Prosthecobacter sp. TaxID=1965333 RepID=UPI00378428A5
MKQNDTPSPPYLTTRDLSARWQVTPMTIRRMRKAGRLKAAFIGRGVRFAMTEVERFEREAEA